MPLLDTVRSYICCGCGASKAYDDQYAQRHGGPHEIPDETTLLIPSEGLEGVNYTDGSYLDQQKLERRLGGIVRSKESKMVKLGYAHPFNLHNKDPDTGTSTISRSHSNSGSSFVHHGQQYQHGHHAYMSSSEHIPQHGQPAYRGQYGTGGGYGPHQQGYEPSPLSHSRSHSRNADDDVHGAHGDENQEYYDDASVVNEQPKPQPILNMRLVGYNPPVQSGTSRGRKMERGDRPSGLGGGGKEVKSKEAAEEGMNTENVDITENDEEVKPSEGEEATDAQGSKQEGTEAKTVGKKKRTFVLDDVDSIAVSWGD